MTPLLDKQELSDLNARKANAHSFCTATTDQGTPYDKSIALLEVRQSLAQAHLDHFYAMRDMYNALTEMGHTSDSAVRIIETTYGDTV
jgi:hypothetical protein